MAWTPAYGRRRSSSPDAKARYGTKPGNGGENDKMHTRYMSVSLSPDNSVNTPPKGIDTREIAFSPSPFSPVTCKDVMQPSAFHPSVHYFQNSPSDSHVHRDSGVQPHLSQGKRPQGVQRRLHNAGRTPPVLEGGVSISTTTTPPSRSPSPNTSRYFFQNWLTFLQLCTYIITHILP